MPNHVSRHFVAACFLLAAAGSPQTAVAQAKPEKPDSAARVKQLPAVRVVERAGATAGYSGQRSSTATKTDTPLRDIPQAVTVVTRDLIADQAMVNMTDVVRYLPGITMGQGEGHRDQPTIRGNATTADFFVDGVRDDAQYLRDLYNIDRVEAIKGPNAMTFGRGGGGGIINRVTREPSFTPLGELTLSGGSFDNKRITTDVSRAFSGATAMRMNGVYENSGTFRDGTRRRRYGVNPTLAIIAGSSTRLVLGFEHFDDHRTTDRGIPSLAGAPYPVSSIRTFFGDPSQSYASAKVDAASATVTRTLGSFSLRNHTRFTRYDKYYQNVYPGAVNSAASTVAISAYSNATERQNIFNQTEVTTARRTGAVSHTLVAGVELGRQRSDNFRNTGYFNGTTTSISAPLTAPTIATPVVFRQSASDADNLVETDVASVYAQDQISFHRSLQAIFGARAERIGIAFRNNRNGQTLSREDRVLSPRAGIVVKPREPMSLYFSSSVSYLPSAGDQFSSLTDVTAGLEPERFTNNEIGLKWDLSDRLAATGAVYRLDRNHTRAPDPVDPARTVQTGSQRTEGFELGLSGFVSQRWNLAGGFSNQHAVITSRTSSAAAGATVPLVPRQTVSVWSRHQLTRRLGAAMGLAHQTTMYAAIDNRVTLPAFTRVDGAMYYRMSPALQLQANVDNLFDRRYFITASGNDNISPGAPRSLRVSLRTGF